MRRLAAIVVALLPGLALAQNLYPTPLDWRPWDRDFGSPGGNSEVMRLPLTQSGAGFDCTGATSCMSFDGGHNLLLRSTLEGGGPAPTGWTQTLGAATSDPVASAYGSNAVAYTQTSAGVDRPYLAQSVTLSANTTYLFSALVEGNPNGATAANILAYSSAPAGATVTWPFGAATVHSAGSVVALQVTTAGTGGGFIVRVGLGASSPIAASVTFSRPALEIGTARGTWVPTTTAARYSVPLDSAGLTWTDNGSTPAVQSTTLPTAASTGAAGPFSDANYYSNGTGADALDSTGDRFGCVAFVPTSFSGANQYLVSNGLLGVSGHHVMLDTSGNFLFRSSNPTNVSTPTTATAVQNGFSVGCWWRTGTAIFAKSNLGTTATNAVAGTEVSGSAYSLRVGRYEGAGFSASNTKILHIVQGLGSCPTPPAPFAASCEGWATYQMSRQFGLIGTRGEEITFTRATTATNEVNGVVWNVPAAVPRVTTQGLLVERASTNYVLNNRTHPKAAEATGALPTGAHVAWHEGTGTMTVAAGTATVTGLSCTAVSPGTLCTFNVTVTGTMAITTSAGTVTKAQIEGGSTKTSEIPTAGTALARNADQATVPTPSGLSPSRWCVEVVGTPYGGRAWGAAQSYLVTGGPNAGANSFRLYSDTAGTAVLNVYDGSPSLRTWTSSAHGFSAGSTHRISGRDNSGVLSVFGDGASLGGSASGAGTGVFSSFPSTLYLGANSAGSLPFDGYLRDLRITRSPLCR